MSQIWIGPFLMVALCLIWFAVQRAWIACMGEPPEQDALERPGYCGTACACRDACPRRCERSVPEDPSAAGIIEELES